VYCTQCSTELDSNARFCSSCGTPVPGTSMPPVPQRDWNLHVSILGWLVIAHAVLTGLTQRIEMRLGEVQAGVQGIHADVAALQLRLEARKSRLLFLFNLLALLVTLMLAWILYSQIVVIRHYRARRAA